MKTGEIGITIITAVCFLALAVAVADYNQEPPPIHIPNNEVCDDVLLRNPGGLSHRIALICYNSEIGWIEFDAQHLIDEDYARIVQPVKDSLRQVAIDRNIYDQRHDIIWNIK